MKHHTGVIRVLLIVMAGVLVGCGGTADTGPTVGKQYSLDVQATMTIAPVAAAAWSTKLDTPQPQVMIGTMIVEVRTNAEQELGVELVSMDLRNEDPLDVDIQISLTPSVSLDGVIFKLDEYGQPFGTSYLNLDLVVNKGSNFDFVVTPGTAILDDGQRLHLGSFQANAELTDRSQLPLLGDIPTIGFLFQGQEHHATMDNLLIVLTPTIISDTD